ncbi:MAG TPA: DUF4405 domain-containing protein [Polyangiaceae bacterium]|nr:DUF4405 domain-containing protein [Polyangiaceae bacterium]
MKQLRVWVTPLTIGTFLVVGSTGVAMFFHANTSLGKVLHEWLGWLLVVAAVLHVVINWNALLGHLKRLGGRLIVGVSAVVLMVALVPMSSGGRGANPNESMRGALSAISRTPLHDLSPIAGRDVEHIVADLHAAGFSDAAADSTCDRLAGKDQARLLLAVKVLFPSKDGARAR